MGRSIAESATKRVKAGITTRPVRIISSRKRIWPRGGHAISLVGWDDTVPAEQFTVTVDGKPYTPAGDGAFIAKNNYGTEKGQNGFLYFLL